MNAKKLVFGEQYTMYQKINVTLKLRIIFPRFGAHLFSIVTFRDFHAWLASFFAYFAPLIEY